MILVPIVEKYDSLSSQEQKIADYIMANPQDAINKTASLLSEATGTSPATVVRFARKIGFDSFTEMRIGLASFFNDKRFFETDMIVRKNDSVHDCSQKLLSQINDVIETTARSVNYVQMEKTVKILDEAKAIYLLAMGSSGCVALDLQQKLIRLRKKVFYLQDSEVNLLSTMTIRKHDAVLCFSFSGATEIVKASVEEAKRNGATIIVVTGNTKSPIAKLADICILSPARERKIRIGAVSSKYSQQFISDLLFMCLISKHYEEAEELTMNANQLLMKSRKG